jgi:hypothetical protein
LFLFDVSMSGVFAMVYGVLLIIAGVMIGKKARPESFAELRSMDRQRLAVFSFAICVVSSGFFCFVRVASPLILSKGFAVVTRQQALDKEWMSGLSTAVKIPMYMVLGTSSCFAISFSVVDTVNTGCCTPDESEGGERASRAIVSSPSQIYSILTGSVAMGAVFGFMFGYLDVEDDDWKLVRFTTDQVTRLTFPPFVCSSALAGAIDHGRIHRWRRPRRLESNFG